MITLPVRAAFESSVRTPIALRAKSGDLVCAYATVIRIVQEENGGTRFFLIGFMPTV
jgi:hypothetical protein